MSNINRKLKRHRKNPMVSEYVETIITFCLSGEKEDVTYCSYNKNFIKNGEDLRIKFSVFFTKLIFSVISEEEPISKYSDFLKKCINNIDKEESTKLINFKIENDRIVYEDKLVGLNVGKILINDYIIYFAGPKLFFEDIKTKKRYMYNVKFENKEVA